MTEAVYLPAPTAQEAPFSPNETLAKVYEFPGVSEEIQPQESLAASWRNLKRGLKGLNERLSVAKTEVKAIGRLVLLDVDGADSIAQKIEPVTIQPEADSYYQPLTLRERIRQAADEIQQDKKQDKLRKKLDRRLMLRDIKNQAKWLTITLGAGALAGYLSTKR